MAFGIGGKVMLYVSNYSIKVNSEEPLVDRFSKIAITDTKDGVTEEVNFAQLCDILKANPDLEIKGLSSFELPGDWGLFISLYIIDTNDYDTYKESYDWDASTQPFKSDIADLLKKVTYHLNNKKKFASLESLTFVSPDIGYEIFLRPDRIITYTMVSQELIDMGHSVTVSYSTEVEPSDRFRVVLREGCFDVQVYHDGAWETRIRYSRQHRDGYLATACVKNYEDSSLRREGFYPTTSHPEAGIRNGLLDVMTYNDNLLPIISDVSFVGRVTIINTNMGRFVHSEHSLSCRTIGNIDPPDYIVTPQTRDIWINGSVTRIKDKVSFDTDTRGNTVLLLSDRPKVYWRLQEFDYDIYLIPESRYERRVDDDDFAGIYDKITDQFITDYMPGVMGDDYLLSSNSDMFGQSISDIQYGIGVAELTAKYCNVRDIMRDAFLGKVGAPVVIFRDVKLTKLPGTDLKCGFKKVPKKSGGLKFTVGNKDYYATLLHSYRVSNLLDGSIKTGDFNYICRYKVGKTYELGVACNVGASKIYVYPLSTLENLIPLEYSEDDCEWRQFNTVGDIQ